MNYFFTDQVDTWQWISWSDGVGNVRRWCRRGLWW